MSSGANRSSTPSSEESVLDWALERSPSEMPDRANVICEERGAETSGNFDSGIAAAIFTTACSSGQNHQEEISH